MHILSEVLLIVDWLPIIQVKRYEESIQVVFINEPEVKEKDLLKDFINNELKDYLQIMGQINFIVNTVDFFPRVLVKDLLVVGLYDKENSNVPN